MMMPRYSEREIEAIRNMMAAFPNDGEYKLAKRLLRAGLLPGRSRGALKCKIATMRHSTDDAKPETPQPAVMVADNRPLIQMLRVLWDGRRMPDDRLKALFIKAAKIAEEVYCDIAKARQLIDKMKPAYLAAEETKEREIQSRMDDIGQEIAKNRLVDRELKQ